MAAIPIAEAVVAPSPACVHNGPVANDPKKGRGSEESFVPDVLHRAAQRAGRADGKQSGSELPRRPEW